MSIIVKNISKLYSEQKALDNVSIEISPGHIVGLLGPNGAGKSTLMKILTGFIPPSSGKVEIDGLDIFEDSLEIRKIIGYLPENNPLYPEMFVKEFLSFAGGLHQIKNLKNRVDEIIQLTGLEVEKRKKIGALSKGYKQRVGLAQALIHDPRILILDEPTSGLDPNQLVEIRNLILSIGKEKTVMLSTHIMQEVEALCDRAIIINKGKIVADDTTSNLQMIRMGENLLQVEFNQSINHNKLSKLEGIITLKNISGNVWEIAVAGEKDIRQEVFQWAVSEKISVLSMQKKEQTLEQIFQNFTNP
ncbi:MAG: gliding motility-associated ABC transporter ATP-binding subunit GldA [Bacteroidales bacterium]|nr:gliding motility-associated ABC transporter ATP-binding subunit GldA [Bacteroidales bacterium]